VERIGDYLRQNLARSSPELAEAQVQTEV
jgi:hypothetical protein